MATMSQRLLERYYSGVPHPYRLFEERVEATVARGTRVLLDAGCGRTAPVLRKYLGRVERLIGVELVDFTDVPPGIETYNANLATLPLQDNSVDLIMSRSVFDTSPTPLPSTANLRVSCAPAAR